ncbi:MAG: type I restriction enzyme HsdR N-terminal domain-containing protein [Bacteroidota bacterium]
MLKLNLPEYKFRIQKSEKGIQIFDSVRKKFVALTPEEWVRQNFIQYLIQKKKYPASLIAVESGLKYNRLKKRSDIIVFNKTGNIWMIIECKSPTIKITQDAFHQVAMYNIGKGKKAEYLTVTNGLKHFCCKIDYKNNTFNFVKNLPDK